MKNLALSVVLALALVGCSEEEAAAPADFAAGKSIAEAQCFGCHELDGRGKAAGIPNLAAQVEKYLLDSLLAYEEGVRTHAALKNLAQELDSADLRNVAGYYASLPPLAGAEAMLPDILSPYDKGKACRRGLRRLSWRRRQQHDPGHPQSCGPAAALFRLRGAGLSGWKARETDDGNVEGARRRRSGKPGILLRIPDTGSARSGRFRRPGRRRAADGPLRRLPRAHGVSTDSATPTLAGQDPQYLVAAIKGYRDQARHHDIMRDSNTDKEIEDIAAFYAHRDPRRRRPGR